MQRRIANLEARAGVELLQRRGRKVEATPAGALVVQRGKYVLAEKAALLDTIRDVGDEPVSLVRLAAPIGIPFQFAAMS